MISVTTATGQMFEREATKTCDSMGTIEGCDNIRGSTVAEYDYNGKEMGRCPG